MAHGDVECQHRSVLDIILLLALPASGKSEIRRYLADLPEDAAASLGLGDQVHVDDYPYVHLMRRIAAETAALGGPPVFFADPSEPFLDARDWITLTLLVDEDVRSIWAPRTCTGAAGTWLLDRFDRVGALAGVPRRFAAMPYGLHSRLAEAIDEDAARLRADLPGDSAGRRTLIVEFARGGPEGGSPPLPYPHGFGHSLRALSPEVLRRAVILHVAVSPQESRRRNNERARPGPEGDASILHHGVPEMVMRRDYGTDDLPFLIASSPHEGFVDVATPEGTIAVPAQQIANEDDLTSQLRDDPASWDPDATAELHRRLATALHRLADAR